MADRMKKPLNAPMKRFSREFERICREELADGETVVVATQRGPCKSDTFPCLADIYVYAGLDCPCSECERDLPKMRELQGWVKQGDYWTCDQLTDRQKAFIARRIEQRESRKADVPQ